MHFSLKHLSRDQNTSLLKRYSHSPLFDHRTLQLPCFQRRPHVRDAPQLHLALRLYRERAHVWQEHYVTVSEEALVDLWFLFEHVEAGGEDFATVKRGDQGGFVHHGSAGRVDNDDAVLHLSEFGGGDDMSGLGLKAICQRALVPIIPCRLG